MPWVHSESDDYVNCLYFIKGSIYLHYKSYFHYKSICFNDWMLLFILNLLHTTFVIPKACGFLYTPIYHCFVFCLIKWNEFPSLFHFLRHRTKGLKLFQKILPLLLHPPFLRSRLWEHIANRFFFWVVTQQSCSICCLVLWLLSCLHFGNSQLKLKTWGNANFFIQVFLT